MFDKLQLARLSEQALENPNALLQWFLGLKAQLKAADTHFATREDLDLLTASLENSIDNHISPAEQEKLFPLLAHLGRLFNPAVVRVLENRKTFRFSMLFIAVFLLILGQPEAQEATPEATYEAPGSVDLAFDTSGEALTLPELTELSNVDPIPAFAYDAYRAIFRDLQQGNTPYITPATFYYYGLPAAKYCAGYNDELGIIGIPSFSDSNVLAAYVMEFACVDRTEETIGLAPTSNAYGEYLEELTRFHPLVSDIIALATQGYSVPPRAFTASAQITIGEDESNEESTVSIDDQLLATLPLTRNGPRVRSTRTHEEAQHFDFEIQTILSYLERPGGVCRFVRTNDYTYVATIGNARLTMCVGQQMPIENAAYKASDYASFRDSLAVAIADLAAFTGKSLEETEAIFFDAGFHLLDTAHPETTLRMNNLRQVYNSLEEVYNPFAPQFEPNFSQTRNGTIVLDQATGTIFTVFVEDLSQPIDYGAIGWGIGLIIFGIVCSVGHRAYRLKRGIAKVEIIQKEFDNFFKNYEALQTSTDITKAIVTLLELVDFAESLNDLEFIKTFIKLNDNQLRLITKLKVERQSLFDVGTISRELFDKWRQFALQTMNKEEFNAIVSELNTQYKKKLPLAQLNGKTPEKRESTAKRLSVITFVSNNVNSLQGEVNLDNALSQIKALELVKEKSTKKSFELALSKVLEALRGADPIKLLNDLPANFNFIKSIDVKPGIALTVRFHDGSGALITLEDILGEQPFAAIEIMNAEIFQQLSAVNLPQQSKAQKLAEALNLSPAEKATVTEVAGTVMSFITSGYSQARFEMLGEELRNALNDSAYARLLYAELTKQLTDFYAQNYSLFVQDINPDAFQKNISLSIVAQRLVFYICKIYNTQSWEAFTNSAYNAIETILDSHPEFASVQETGGMKTWVTRSAYRLMIAPAKFKDGDLRLIPVITSHDH
jgi:hypothetical protein